MIVSFQAKAILRVYAKIYKSLGNNFPEFGRNDYKL